MYIIIIIIKIHNKITKNLTGIKIKTENIKISQIPQNSKY